jgi:hypothetical protein
MNVTEMEYETLNRFVVKVTALGEESSDEDSLSLAFVRHGLFSWKLAGIAFD